MSNQNEVEQPMDITIGALCKLSAEIAQAHGWNNPFEKAMLLVHSEISEAAEEVRNHHGLNEVYFNQEAGINGVKYFMPCGEDTPGAKPEGVPIELADAIIRIADFCGQNGIDLAKAILLKTEYNKSRPFKHGNKVF